MTPEQIERRRRDPVGRALYPYQRWLAHYRILRDRVLAVGGAVDPRSEETMRYMLGKCREIRGLPPR